MVHDSLGKEFTIISSALFSFRLLLLNIQHSSFEIRPPLVFPQCHNDTGNWSLPICALYSSSWQYNISFVSDLNFVQII